MSEEIQKTIDYLTQKFGSTGADLWQAIVTQMHFEGCMGIGYFVICLALWPVLVLGWSKFNKYGEEKGWPDIPSLVAGVIVLGVSSVLLFGFTLANIAHLTQNISKINNPTYWAAKEILKK